MIDDYVSSIKIISSIEDLRSTLIVHVHLTEHLAQRFKQIACNHVAATVAVYAVCIL